MDFNSLFRRHQISLMAAKCSMTARGERTHEPFARDYAEQIHAVHGTFGAPPGQRGSVT